MPPSKNVSKKDTPKKSRRETNHFSKSCFINDLAAKTLVRYFGIMIALMKSRTACEELRKTFGNLEQKIRIEGKMANKGEGYGSCINGKRIS